VFAILSHDAVGKSDDPKLVGKEIGMRTLARRDRRLQRPGPVPDK